jgi:hypothetical protein
MINLANVVTGKLRVYFNTCGILKSDRGIALPRNSSEII